MSGTIRMMAMAFVAFFFVAVLSGCGSGGGDDGGDDNDDDTTTTLYLVIPGADFHTGTPSGTANANAVKPTITNKTGTSVYTADRTITWTAEWSQITEITATDVTDIIIEVESLGGYFDYKLSDVEITNQTADIDTYVTWTRPDKNQICNRDYRGNGTCYEQADTGVTEMSLDFTVAAYLEVVDEEPTFNYIEPTPEVIEVPSEEDGSTTGQVCTIGSTDWGGMTCGTEYCVGLSTCCDACNISACVTSNSDCSSAQTYYRTSDPDWPGPYTVSEANACALAVHCTSVCYGVTTTCD